MMYCHQIGNFRIAFSAENAGASLCVVRQVSDKVMQLTGREQQCLINFDHRSNIPTQHLCTFGNRMAMPAYFVGYFIFTEQFFKHFIRRESEHLHTDTENGYFPVCIYLDLS